jgi:riboflavin synthase
VFTGIIKAKVKAIKIKKTSNSMVVFFPIPKGWKLEEGESINIDGVCSTATKITKTSFEVFYMDETLKKTNLSKLNDNHFFNLERSLTASSRMGGHFVAGHIDVTGVIKSIKKEDESKVFAISIPKKFIKYLIYKGSVAINGVSLTVVSVNKESFSVSLIPHTLDKTNLGELEKGDLLNIELDMLAKYMEKVASLPKLLSSNLRLLPEKLKELV